MEVLDFILDGLEKALELERELGIRSVEIDRKLIASAIARKDPPREPPREYARLPRSDFPVQPPRLTRGEREEGTVRERPTEGGAMRSIAEAPEEVLSARSPIHRSLVFLHDRPLSEKGVEMMAKIVQKLGFTPEQAPLVIHPPIPAAKIYVFLGFTALRQYMPTLRIEENTWGKSPKGKDILVVKSPEEIVRFETVSPALRKIKEEMWRSLKSIVRRLG